jgi:hypothetical protein
MKYFVGRFALAPKSIGIKPVPFKNSIREGMMKKSSFSSSVLVLRAIDEFGFQGRIWGEVIKIG